MAGVGHLLVVKRHRGEMNVLHGAFRLGSDLELDQGEVDILHGALEEALDYDAQQPGPGVDELAGAAPGALEVKLEARAALHQVGHVRTEDRGVEAVPSKLSAEIEGPGLMEQPMCRVRGEPGAFRLGQHQGGKRLAEHQVHPS